MTLAGTSPDDLLRAAALRHAAERFRITIAADRQWTFNPAAQQADTGHFQINRQMEAATEGSGYDVVPVADETGAFGDSVAYRTQAPRPVAGTHRLVATAWTPVMDEYGGTQLQGHFRRLAGRAMGTRDYTAWLAARAIGEAATRGGADPVTLAAYLRGPDFQLAGYKGMPLSFRAWDG